MQYRKYPFHQRPTNYRKRAWIGIKNEIRADVAIGGGVFTSSCLMEAVPEGGFQWLDICFLSRTRNQFYNACFLTGANQLMEEAQSIAFEEVAGKLTKEEEELEFSGLMEFVVVKRDAKGKPLLYERKPREKLRYDKFEGRSYFEEVDHVRNQILAERPPPVYEFFKVDPKYSFGIGLEAVIDVPMLYPEKIIATIERFLDGGEVNWKAAQPIPADTLPTQYVRGHSVALK